MAAQRFLPTLARLGPAATLALLGLMLPLAAQSPAPKPDAPKPDSAKAEQRSEREQELRRTEESLQKNEADRLRLQREIEQLRGDRAKLNADLIETSKRVRGAEEKISSAEERLSTLTGSERALRQSLESRQDVIVEVLAALQRIGRRPPPAVIVRAEDMLEAVRSSLLLGAVLPELRAEAEALAVDLNDLVRMRTQIVAERDLVSAERDALLTDRKRLEGLVAARQSDLATAEKTLAEERQKAGALARQAQTLKELVARMESESVAAKRAADEAAKSPQPAQSSSQVAQLAANAFKDPARLAPKIAFTDARGILNLPVAGTLSRAFGSPDGFGGSEKGITISTAPGALVTAPVDGWVAFSGPFRSYRNVLIINVGGGYHVVMIGMDRVTVDVGQFVLAGEPLAVMSSIGSASGQPAESAIRPGLYVEFRKDGVPIDPSPWWAKAELEKARG